MINNSRWDVQLANYFKERDNPEIDEPVIGKVVSNSPLKISVLNNNVILTSDLVYICKSAESLAVDDYVLCLPTAKGQKYFIVDKVVV